MAGTVLILLDVVLGPACFLLHVVQAAAGLICRVAHTGTRDEDRAVSGVGLAEAA